MSNRNAKVMAIDALLGMTSEERLAFAKAVLLEIKGANLIHKLEQAANEIGRHAHELQRKHMPLRTDGSIIHPYAPDGGPLGDHT